MKYQFKSSTLVFSPGEMPVDGFIGNPFSNRDEGEHIEHAPDASIRERLANGEKRRRSDFQHVIEQAARRTREQLLNEMLEIEAARDALADMVSKEAKKTTKKLRDSMSQERELKSQDDHPGPTV